MNSNPKLFGCISLILLAGYGIGVHWYIPNMGGVGLELPQNMTLWLVMALVVMTVSILWCSAQQRSWISSPALKWLLLGGILYSLPLLWTPHEAWRWDAAGRVLGLWGGIVFYFALLQIPLSPRRKNLWLLFILFAVLAESGLSLLQLFVFNNVNNWMEYNPDYGRPYGNFQQVNVLASFIATGFAIALRLFVSYSYRAIRILSALSLVLFSFLLVLLQSRIGLYSASLVLILFICRYCLHPQLMLIVALPCAGAIVGMLFEWLLPGMVHVDKDGSNAERLLLIEHSLNMIATHPLSGWGYGSFSYEVVRHGFPTRAIHPHNELLYAWVEGGILALTAMLFIAWTGLQMMFSGSRLNKRITFPLWIVLLPIALHLMTEFPLYQSVTHWMTLLILCRLATREQTLQIHQISVININLLRTSMAAAALATGLFMLSGFTTNSVLTQAEREGVQNSEQLYSLHNPYPQLRRWSFDQHIGMLQQFNRTHDSTLLDTFNQWGEQYLLLRNDANVFDSLIQIARFEQHYTRMAALKHQAALIFPDDPRFR